MYSFSFYVLYALVAFDFMTPLKLETVVSMTFKVISFNKELYVGLLLMYEGERRKDEREEWTV